jgi:hypothetical protein
MSELDPVTKLQLHEAVCAERYLHIKETLGKLEEQNQSTMRILWAVAAAFLLSFLGITIKFVFGA